MRLIIAHQHARSKEIDFIMGNFISIYNFIMGNFVKKTDIIMGNFVDNV